MKKVSWMEKLIIKTQRELMKAKSRLLTYYWIVRIHINKDVKVPNICVEDKMDFCTNDGLMYLDFEEYEKALKHFEKMIKLDPGYFYGYRLVGMAYAGKGKKEEARKNYRKALKLALKNRAGEEGESGSILDDDMIEEIREDLAEMGEACGAKEV